MRDDNKGASYFACADCGASWSLEGDHTTAVCPNCDKNMPLRPRAYNYEIRLDGDDREESASATRSREASGVGTPRAAGTPPTFTATSASKRGVRDSEAARAGWRSASEHAAFLKRLVAWAMGARR